MRRLPVPVVVLICACAEVGEVGSRAPGAAGARTATQATEPTQSTKPTTPPGQDEFAADRQRMVAEQIAARDVRDPRVLAAMRDVPRHLFVPPDLERQAYADRPLPIGYE